MGAVGYVDDQLRGIEDILSNSIETSRARSENLVQSLQGFLDVVSQNRAQLFPAEPEEEAKENTEKEAQAENNQPEVTNISISTESAGEE